MTMQTEQERRNLVIQGFFGGQQPVNTTAVNTSPTVPKRGIIDHRRGKSNTPKEPASGQLDPKAMAQLGQLLIQRPMGNPPLAPRVVGAKRMAPAIFSEQHRPDNNALALLSQVLGGRR